MWKERKRGEYEKELVVEVETPISIGKKGKGGLVGKGEEIDNTTERKGEEGILKEGKFKEMKQAGKKSKEGSLEREVEKEIEERRK